MQRGIDIVGQPFRRPDAAVTFYEGDGVLRIEPRPGVDEAGIQLRTRQVLGERIGEARNHHRVGLAQIGAPPAILDVRFQAQQVRERIHLQIQGRRARRGVAAQFLTGRLDQWLDDGRLKNDALCVATLFPVVAGQAAEKQARDQVEPQLIGGLLADRQMVRRDPVLPLLIIRLVGGRLINPTLAPRNQTQLIHPVGVRDLAPGLLLLFDAIAEGPHAQPGEQYKRDQRQGTATKEQLLALPQHQGGVRGPCDQPILAKHFVNKQIAQKEGALAFPDFEITQRIHRHAQRGCQIGVKRGTFPQGRREIDAAQEQRRERPRALRKDRLEILAQPGRQVHQTLREAKEGVHLIGPPAILLLRRRITHQGQPSLRQTSGDFLQEFVHFRRAECSVQLVRIGPAEHLVL